MSRQFKFKAWNTETNLLMRLNQIDCEKGVLIKKDHILLQFTGHHDMNGSEIYEADILLYGTDKRMVVWDEDLNAWNLIGEQRKITFTFNKQELSKGKRLCSYYESPGSFKK